jgi:hypothetical protein
MLTPAPPPPDARGTRWLQTKTEEILALHAVALAPPRFEGDCACYWGTAPQTYTTLFLRLAGDPETKALRFSPTMIAKCGSGLYVMQSTAVLFIRRELTKMGILHP